MKTGDLAQTVILPEPERYGFASQIREHLCEGALVAEHCPIPFPTYPYEWAPEMLQAAAELTLRLAESGLRAGYTLKDATPYNVMFHGARPVFLDVLSFTERNSLEPVWRPYAQFLRTFVYPLLAVRYFGISLEELLLANRDGIEPERLSRLASIPRRLSPSFFSSVTLPALLGKREASNSQSYAPRQAASAGEAEFLLCRVFAHARKELTRASVPVRNSGWANYMDSELTYLPDEFAAKERFVTESLAAGHARRVLDLGCNTGHFSRIAAKTGASVVAVDGDAACVGEVWRQARDQFPNILPLVINIARPPGATGWANQECPSFLDRAQGQFDCVLMLALVHHLIVSERVPLDRIFELASHLTTHTLVIEYVDPADPQFRRIARGRDALHADLTLEQFESAAREYFDVEQSVRVTETRRLYRMRKHP